MSDIGIRKFRVEIPRSGATPSTPGFVVSEGQDPVNPPGSPTGIYVPYLGATGAVNLGEFGLLAGNLVFNTTPTNIPTDQGTMYWDDARQTVALIMNGTTQHIGQDQFVYVKNSSGSPIAKGVAVRNSGTDGGSGHILIEPFLADGTHASETYLGVTSEAISNGGFGQVMTFGELGGVNTNSYTAGAFLYVSTTVAGQFQTTAPVAPNNIILVGRAINSKNNGDIFIRPHIGSNIRNDEGVSLTSPATGDLLQLQSNGLFENRSLVTLQIPTGTGANGRVTFWTGTNTVGSDAGFLWDNTNKSLSVISQVTNESRGISIRQFTNNSAGAGFYIDKARGTFASPLNVVSGDVVGAFNFRARVNGAFTFDRCIFGSMMTSLTGQSLFFIAGNTNQNYVPNMIFDENGGTGIGLGGNILTTVNRPIGRLDVRGLGTGTGITLLLEDSAGNNTFEFLDNGNLSIPSANGAKIGTATSQKISLWNATPIVQPTTGIAESAFVENLGGTIINDDSTFDGYTLRQVVKALRDFGLLA